jgi:hypothetical protein
MRCSQLLAIGLATAGVISLSVLSGSRLLKRLAPQPPPNPRRQVWDALPQAILIPSYQILSSSGWLARISPRGCSRSMKRSKTPF